MANKKLTGDLGEILCAKFLPKIFGEKSIVIRTGSENYPFDLLVISSNKNKRPTLISVKTRSLEKVVRNKKVENIPHSVPFPKKNINKNFDTWVGLVLLRESDTSFGIYFLPLKELKRCGKTNYTTRPPEFKTQDIISKAKELEFFFESENFLFKSKKFRESL
jgi:hypothetical protein